MDAIYDNTIQLVNSLSIDKLKEAYNFLSYLNDKEEWEATLELNSPTILQEIKQGLEDIKSGNFIEFKKIRRNV
jgi:hypothetical protein